LGQVLEAKAESQTRASSEAGIPMDLVVSPRTDAELGRLAKEIGGTKTDVLAWGVALLSLALEAENRGKRLVIVDEAGGLDTEIKLNPIVEILER
jgi:hypothetical protein